MLARQNSSFLTSPSQFQSRQIITPLLGQNTKNLKNLMHQTRTFFNVPSHQYPMSTTSPHTNAPIKWQRQIWTYSNSPHPVHLFAEFSRAHKKTNRRTMASSWYPTSDYHFFVALFRPSDPCHGASGSDSPPSWTSTHSMNRWWMALDGARWWRSEDRLRVRWIPRRDTCQCHRCSIFFFLKLSKNLSKISCFRVFEVLTPSKLISCGVD